MTKNNKKVEYISPKHFFNPAVQRILIRKQQERILEMMVNPSYFELKNKETKSSPKYTHIELLTILDNIVIKLGAYPTSKVLKQELKSYSVSLKTFRNRFQNIKNIESSYHEWVSLNKPFEYGTYNKKEFSKDEKNFMLSHIDSCECCGSKEDLVVDHWLPWSFIQYTSIDNAQVLCKKCNREKSDKLPITIEEFEKESALLEGFSISIKQNPDNQEMKVLKIA